MCRSVNAFSYRDLRTPEVAFGCGHRSVAAADWDGIGDQGQAGGPNIVEMTGSTVEPPFTPPR